MLTQFFNGINFVYRGVEVYRTFRSYLRVLVRIQTSTMADDTNYTGDLPRYVLDQPRARRGPRAGPAHDPILSGPRDVPKL